MSSILDLPRLKVPPIVIPPTVLLVAEKLGIVMNLTCSAAPEQYELTRNGEPCGYIRARHGFSVSFPDAGGEVLYEGHHDGFGAFTDAEREAKLLLSLGLIAARMLRNYV